MFHSSAPRHPLKKNRGWPQKFFGFSIYRGFKNHPIREKISPAPQTRLSFQSIWGKKYGRIKWIIIKKKIVVFIHNEKEKKILVGQ